MAGNQNSGKSGPERDPEKTCTATGCNAWRIRGGTVCVGHGGRLPVVKNAAKQAVLQKEVVGMAAEIDIDVPMQVRPEDFRRICAEYVARFNRVYSRLEAELDEMRDTVHTEIEIARLYADILDRQEKSASLVTKMMTAAAALGVDVSLAPDTEQAVADLLWALDESRTRQQSMDELL